MKLGVLWILYFSLLIYSSSCSENATEDTTLQETDTDPPVAFRKREKSCQYLDYDPYLNFEITQAGNNEQETSSGAIAKVSCVEGFEIYVRKGHNVTDTITCEGGKWKPRMPSCRAAGCRAPQFQHGQLLKGRKTAAFNESIKHRVLIELKCIRGYVIKGNPKMTCWYGQWDADYEMECVPRNIRAPLPSPEKFIANQSCTFQNTDENVLTFLSENIVGNGEEIPTGSVTMVGASRRKCVTGQWLGVSPKCQGLNQMHDYNLNKPPTILLRVENGSMFQSNEGKLLVHEGTTLNLICLWLRKFGSPKWNWTISTKEYQRAWENQNSTLEYQLTIKNAGIEDSGIFKCTTPARYSHQIEIIVSDTTCPELDMRSDVLIYKPNSERRGVGTEVLFECTDDSTLKGIGKIQCLPNGNWSGKIPSCVKQEETKQTTTVTLNLTETTN